MPEQGASSVREKAQPSPGKVLRYLGYFLHGAAMLAFLALAFTSFSALRMAISGVDGEATVVDLRTDTYRTARSYGGGSGTVASVQLRTDHYVTYKFLANTREYQQERRVTKELFDALNPGKAVTIRYLPGAPETNQIDQEWVRSSVIVPALLAIFFFSGGCLFVWVGKNASFKKPNANG